MTYYNLLFPEQITAGMYHYLLYFHDISTRKRVVYLDSSAWDDEDHDAARYYFEEGNGCCDCNRSMWMYDDEEGYECEGNDEEKRIFIEKMICLETGETVAENI